MGNLSVNIDLLNKDTLRQLKVFEAKQLPFAVAVALTKTVKIGQRASMKGMMQDFELRNKKRMLKGVRITPAKKQDWKRGRIFADVYDIDEFLVIHSEGGIRRPQSGNKLAIPGDELIKRGARTASGKIKKRWRPTDKWFKSINRKPGRPRKKGRSRKPMPFATKGVRGNTIIGIRTGRKRKPVDWFYQFSSIGKFRKKWKFGPDIRKSYLRNYGKIFVKAMDKAVATSFK